MLDFCALRLLNACYFANIRFEPVFYSDINMTIFEILMIRIEKNEDNLYAQFVLCV